jgi:predicted kinase
MASCHGYLALAATSLERGRSALIITHGLPGSGKTTFAQAALERFGAIRIRSDVERKRLHDLPPLADSRSRVGTGLYDAEATRRTYARLLELAGELLKAGYTVIVDAAFLRHEERAQFMQLSLELDVPFAIASLQAGSSTLQARISQRLQAGSDASEADHAVLQMLQEKQELLSPEEYHCTVEFMNEGAVFAESAWTQLEQHLHLPST